MPNDPACGNTPAMSRRTLLTALPASGVALTVPQIAQATTTDTPILRLFREHQKIKRATHAFLETAGPEISDEYIEARFSTHTDRIEDEMMATPATCAADMAAKMIAAHCNGEFSCLGWDDPVWLEARQLTGSA